MSTEEGDSFLRNMLQRDFSDFFVVGYDNEGKADSYNSEDDFGYCIIIEAEDKFGNDGDSDMCDNDNGDTEMYRRPSLVISY